MEANLAQLINRGVIYTVDGLNNTYSLTTRVFNWLMSPRYNLSDLVLVIEQKGIGYLFNESSKSRNVDVDLYRTIIRLIDDIYHGCRLILQMPELNILERSFMFPRMREIANLVDATGLSKYLSEIRKQYIDKSEEV